MGDAGSRPQHAISIPRVRAEGEMNIVRLGSTPDAQRYRRYQFKPWKLLLVAGVILSIAIWYEAWVVLRVFMR